jgi:hypothetical protein
VSSATTDQAAGRVATPFICSPLRRRSWCGLRRRARTGLRRSGNDCGRRWRGGQTGERLGR